MPSFPGGQNTRITENRSIHGCTRPRGLFGWHVQKYPREAFLGSSLTVQESPPPVELTPDLPLEVATRIYAKGGRVHIPAAFRQPVANAIFQRLFSNTPWRLVYNESSEHKEIPLADFQRMGERAYLDLLDVTARRGSTSFQYVYRSYPIFDHFSLDRATGDPYLMQVVEFLNSRVFLGMMRQLIGDESIEIVDANATLYEAGHFLTRHDDDIKGKNRVAAYVINLTPVWSADWGGILNFHAGDGHVTEGYIPTFNALNVFKVPQMHAVSYVTPLAGAGRYSIAGWFRRASR